MNVHALRRSVRENYFFTVDWLLAALFVLLLTACGGSQQAPPVQAAVDIHKGDACAVCGMYIDAGPGPRAEAWVQGYKAPLKFGSTRDFFAYVTDPENKTRLQQLLVQDSAQINWQRPPNQLQTFVDARTAWYVAWQPLNGLMGPTFASFAKRADAEVFIHAQGGEILSFAEVTPPLISLLGYACPSADSPAFALAKACVAAPHSASPSLPTRDENPDLLHRANPVPGQTNPAPQEHQHSLLDANTH